MALERAILESVKDQIVTVGMPYLGNANFTYLTNEIVATGTTLTVKDTDGFADDDYIIIGSVGAKQSEIRKIGAAVSAGTSLTIGATVFAHPVGTKVTLIRYNQVEIYGDSTSDASAPTIIGSAETIDVSAGKNIIEVATGDIQSFYYARYKNSNDSTFSAYADSVGAAGLSPKARGEIKNEFLSMHGEKKDDLITNDWLNRTINRWQRELSKRYKRWTCLKETTITDLTEDKQGYALPDDVQDKTNDSIISIKVKGEPELRYVDNQIFIKKTADHIGSTVSTAAVVTDTTLVIADSSDFTQEDATVFALGNKIGYTLNTESTGTFSGITAATAITAFADAGSGSTTVTSAGHGFSDDDTAYIQGTRNYDGTYTVSGVAGNDFNIVKDFVANDATGAVASVDDAISEALAVNTEVWQTRTTGQPTHFTIDPENDKIKLYPIPNSVWDLKNLTTEYWKEFPVLADDADETLFFFPDNCFKYLDYQLAVRRSSGEQLILSKKSEWEDDLEAMVDDDTDFTDNRIEPRNIYFNPY